jgi:hypothetical protein
MIALVPVRPLQQLIESIGVVVDIGVQVPELSEPSRHGGDGEVLGIGVSDLVPAQGRRDDAFGCTAYGICAGDRVIWL